MKIAGLSPFWFWVYIGSLSVIGQLKKHVLKPNCVYNAKCDQCDQCQDSYRARLNLVPDPFPARPEPVMRV